MKKIKKLSKILFFSIYLVLGLFFTESVLATEEIRFTPQIGIPGSEFNSEESVSIGKKNETTVTSDLLAKYVKAFYVWGLSIVGVAAVLTLMAGGLIWLTSAGNNEMVGLAKKMINGSFLGSIVLLGAYFILNTINPNLAKLPAIKMDNIEKKAVDTYLICCNNTRGEVKTRVKIENGKKIALEGDLIGKPITCGKTTAECDNSKQEKCILSIDSKYYCAIDSWCCQCRTGLIFNSCKTNMSIKSCTDWCGDLTGKIVGWRAEFFNTNDYSCNDNKCIEK